MAEQPASGVALALALEREGRHGDALRALHDVAKSGDAEAQFQLGVRLLPTMRGPEMQALGQRWLNGAAERGHGEALHLLAVLAAAGFGDAPDWDAAMMLLQRAAAAGHQRSLAQRSLLGEDFAPKAWLQPPPARMQFESPRVGIIEEFLPAPMCDWLKAGAAPRLKQASVRLPSGEMLTSDVRSNAGAHFTLLQSDVVVRLAQARIAEALGVAATQFEFPNVLRYEIGQTFRPHQDYLEPTTPEFAQRMQQVGQRIATFLIYLNDDFEGGETDFPRLSWKYRGRTGDALFFWNVSAEGAVEPSLLHAGLPPTKGEKWVFSQWVRAKTVPLI